jgi:hypothetical protein
MKTDGSILVWLVAATVLTIGCHPTQPTPLPTSNPPTAVRAATGETPADHAPTTTRADKGETLDDIRASWTNVRMKKDVGKDFDDAYLQRIRQRPRGEAFEVVVGRLVRPINQGDVTGNQLLDLLGRPDFWIHLADGEIFLVYFWQSAGGIKWEDTFQIDADGYVRNVGKNHVGVNVYGPEWHRD